MTVSSKAPTSNRSVATLRRSVPSLVAWVVRAAALLSLTALFIRPGQHVRGPVQDAVIDGLALAVTIATAGVMLVLARALARRKRRAWRVVLAVTVVAALLYGRVTLWEPFGLNLATATRARTRRRRPAAASRAR